MMSDEAAKNDIEISIQKTLASINDITMKIKKELEIINDLVNEDGQLYIAVNTANLALSQKVQEMGMNIKKIMRESKRKARLEPNISSITSAVITEKLLAHLDG